MTKFAEGLIHQKPMCWVVDWGSQSIDGDPKIQAQGLLSPGPGARAVESWTDFDWSLFIFLAQLSPKPEDATGCES